AGDRAAGAAARRDRGALPRGRRARKRGGRIVSDRARPDQRPALDPELARLLLDELRRHQPPLETTATEEEQRRAVHALKGSAGIAGERGLAETFARIERRLHGGDPLAAHDARLLVNEAIAALAAGRPVPS